MRERIIRGLNGLQALSTVVVATAFVPQSVFAQTFVESVGLFNIFVGLMLVAALLTYGIAFIMWLSRLNTWPSNRTEGIKVMEWAVAILFVLVVILMIVQFFRDHPAAATYVVAAVILIILAWAIFQMVKGSGEKKEEH